MSNAVPLPPTNQLAIAPKPPRPFHITLMCDFSPDTNVVAYRWYRGGNSLPVFTSAILTTNNWVTESNLWPGVNYEFVVSYVTRSGTESPWSPITHWPQPLTNYLAFGVSGSLSGTWTTSAVLARAEQVANYRLKRQPLGYELHESPNFMAWTVATNWPASSPLPTFYLRGSHWENTGFAHPD